jgi:hypothetical protein
MARRINRPLCPNGVQIPGLRAYIRARETETAEWDPRFDPRLDVTAHLSSRQRKKLNESPDSGVHGARATVAAIDAGEDVVIPSWRVGGNQFPEARELLPWLPDYASIVVDANDFVRPGDPESVPA